MQVGLDIHIVALIVFWLALLPLLHTYVVYPIMVFLIGITRNNPIKKHSFTSLPTVTVVISLYNEETVLEEKMKNLEATNYPHEKLSILLGSDGSTDRTNAILGRCEKSNVGVHVFPTRRGKAAVLNDLVAKSQGEVIVFSDANTNFQSDTIRRLVEPLANTDVGAVCGELVLLSDARTTGGLGERAYWKIENMLKTYESRISTVLGATGAVYAIRRSQISPLPLGKVVMDDFLLPLGVVKRGFRIVYESRAVAFEKPSNSVEGEFRRRVRIAAANFNGISEYASLLNPRHGFVAFALWSHKILRWIAPLLFLLVAGSSLLMAGSSSFFSLVLWIQVTFLLIALIGFVSD